ncbi:hypothetical protein GF339_11215, partial [candidate division KSB3 bacterium]|nr:hypothetical protein [candidate division KSB3 bacterium]MBD3325146.1 hypothetical protein [candidate division KSB3 bacterium]
MDAIKTRCRQYLYQAVFLGVMIAIAGCNTISFSPPGEEPEVSQETEAATSTFQRARQLFEAGQLQAAIELWEQILPTDPQYLEAQYAIRDARLQLEGRHAEPAESAQPTSTFEALIAEAEQLEQQGDLRMAVERYEEARVLNPDHPGLSEKIADLHALLE